MAKRELQEINASSMADIAFLLLIFFLMVTTMDQDRGLTVKLPPIPEDDEIIDQDINRRNVLNILVNTRDQMLVNDQLIDVSELRQMTLDFVQNNGVNPKYSDSPQKAVVSLKNDRGTSYDIYIQIHNELKAAYNEMWDAEAQRLYSMNYADLETKEKRLEVRKVAPYRISEAEPENVGGN